MIAKGLVCMPSRRKYCYVHDSAAVHDTMDPPNLLDCSNIAGGGDCADIDEDSNENGVHIHCRNIGHLCLEDSSSVEPDYSSSS